MQQLDEAINRIIREDAHGVKRSVQSPRNKRVPKADPYTIFFADNATGDDLSPGDVVEITAFDGIEYAIRKPSAVNLLNVAICVTKAPVGSRVELTTDGTHTVPVTGSVALGSSIGTQAGSTELATIAVGESNYPAVGFIAMSASSGGSCQARFFSSGLQCRQPDRAFVTTARIGVGGGSEDVTVADLYELRDWMNGNPELSADGQTDGGDSVAVLTMSEPYNQGQWLKGMTVDASWSGGGVNNCIIIDTTSETVTIQSPADVLPSSGTVITIKTPYHAYIATLYGDQELDSSLSISGTLVLNGAGHIITTAADITLSNTYANTILFELDEDSDIEIQCYVCKGCSFVYVGDDQIEIDISATIACGCSFVFDRLENLRLEFDYADGCTFIILEDLSLDTEKSFFMASSNGITNSSFTLLTTGVWYYGAPSLTYEIDATLTNCVYTYDHSVANTRLDAEFDFLFIDYSCDITHPALEYCTATVEENITLTGSLFFDDPESGVEFGTFVSIDAEVTHNTVKGMTYAPSLTTTIDMPDGKAPVTGGYGDAGGATINVVENLAGELDGSTIDMPLTAYIDGGNGTRGIDGADGTYDENPSAGNGSSGAPATLCEMVVTRDTNLSSIINTSLASTVLLNIDGGTGGTGGNGGKGASTETFLLGNIGGDGGDGGFATVFGDYYGIPQYTHSFSCETIYNSHLREERTIVASGGRGGDGGTGGDGGYGVSENGPGGEGGNGGDGRIGGNGGTGGKGYNNSPSDGLGGTGGFGFTAGNGGVGGDGLPSSNDDGGNGGAGGDGFEVNDNGVPNTAGAGGDGGLGVGTGADGDDGAAGDPNGETDRPRYIFNGVLYLYQVAVSTNTDYLTDDAWPGSMGANGTIYIDHSSGDDTNDGQSWAEAIKNFPLFTRDGDTVGYLISDVKYADFTGQQIGVLRPESEVTTYRTITGDDTEFSSNPAGQKISLLDCQGDFDGFDIVNACDGTFANCIGLYNCTGTLATNCTGVDLCGNATTRFGVIEYCNDVTNTFAESFYGCTGMSVCDGKGFTNCYTLDLCDSHDAYRGFVNCSLLTNSDSYDNIDWGFYQCRQLDWSTCREYDNGNSCDCPPTTKYPINCPNKDDCNA